MTGLEMLSKFMEVNMHIKNTLMKMAPNATSNYSEETKMKYMDKLLNYTDILKDDFIIINKIFPNIFDKEFINNFFNNLNLKIENFNYKHDSVNNFFNKYYADISNKIINDVNENFHGYYPTNLNNILRKSKTINEILHVMHTYITQTEFVYEETPDIAKKELDHHNKVSLKGKDTLLARMIYDNLPHNLSSGWLYILSVNENQVFVMARDLGHSLTIDITLYNNTVLVKYYIPKLCNIEMIKNLNGIKKIVNNNDILGWATGDFHCSIEEFIKEFNNFILSVPTDNDMILRY